jgi:hypothetical protein
MLGLFGMRVFRHVHFDNFKGVNCNYLSFLNEGLFCLFIFFIKF